MGNNAIYQRSIRSMTAHLDISIVYEENRQADADKLIDAGYAEAERLIGIISAWQAGTELYEVNANAGIKPVRVCKELFELVRRSIHISRLTDGAFDVTFASIDKVWYFDRPMLQLPTAQEIANSVRNIGYEHIHLDAAAQTIYVDNKGTKIELGAIGKGFIANKMQAKLQSLGVTGGVVNAGGDLTTWGKNEVGEDWKIGIADPDKKEKHIAWLRLCDQAVATSGSYERFAMINGVRHSHIIDPKTGHPVRGLQSVTVLSPDAELCDVVATSVFLLGLKSGLTFVNQFHDVQCFIVDDDNNYHYSNNLKKIPYAEHAV